MEFVQAGVELFLKVLETHVKEKDKSYFLVHAERAPQHSSSSRSLERHAGGVSRKTTGSLLVLTSRWRTSSPCP